MSESPPAPVALPSSAALRWFVYLTAGLAGAAVMVIEILGTRMLAPYMGSSHFVWTAQIAVTLISLATGYYLGGRLVDSSPVFDWIFGGLIVAGAYLSLTTLLCPTIARVCSQLDLALGALLTSFILFFVPLTLLAMVGPFLTRMLAFSVATVGGQVGRLSAVSTVGSFIGTILIGYVLLPIFHNSTIMYLTALSLGLAGAAYFLLWRRRSGAKLAIVPLGALGFAIGSTGIGSEHARPISGFVELFSANSNFGLIQVLRRKASNQTYYLTDKYPHNDYDAGNKVGGGYYIYAIHELARAYAVGPLDDMLVIGMGVGTGPMYFAKNGTKVDIVEINGAAVPVAAKYFDFEPSQFQIFVGDGRYFINEARKKYDCIVVDAFLGDALPGHLMTHEAFAAMQRLLKPGAPLVINTNILDFGDDFYSASLMKTLNSVFTSTVIHRGGAVNKFFVSADRRLTGVPDDHALSANVPASFKERVHGVLKAVTPAETTRGQVLLDDYNPVDVLDAKNRQILHQAFTQWFRTD